MGALAGATTGVEVAATALLSGTGTLTGDATPAADVDAALAGIGVLTASAAIEGVGEDIVIDGYTIPRGWWASTIPRGWRSTALRNAEATASPLNYPPLRV